MSSKIYNIKLNGKVYEVEIEEVKQAQVLKEVPTPDKNQKVSEISETGEVITAPMPGSMFNILVTKGQKVKKGDVVAILEAMKMENEIIAPVDGQIVSVKVDKGQNVDLGDIILEIA